MSLTLKCVDWESRFRQGKLGISGLFLQMNEFGVTVELLHEIVKSDFGEDPTRLIGIIGDVERKYLHQAGARDVCQAIREAAFEPLGCMLVDFLLRGDLSADIYGEFFIARSKDTFVVVERKVVPKSLSHMTDNILSTGLSAHLLTRMGVVANCSPLIEEMRSHPSRLLDSNYCTVAVRETRAVLNKQLLLEVNKGDAFAKEVDIFKRFFFISESDWYSEFLPLVVTDLEKPFKAVNRVRLNEIARSVSSGQISIVMHSPPDGADLLCVRALTISRRPVFPLDVIFTDNVIVKFQSVFRSLFFCRYIEGKLNGLWSELHSLHSLEADESLLACHLLLQRMLHFVKNYLFFLTVDVVESKGWKSILDSKSVFQARDELEQKLNLTIEEMGLNAASVAKSVNKVFSTCGLFSAHMTRFVQILLSEAETARQQDKYLTLISKFQDAYEGQVNSLMVQLKQSAGTQGLIARLDFNHYLSESLGI